MRPHRVPTLREGEAALYVIAFSNGVVKVGRTVHIPQRIHTHVADARKYDVSVEKIWISDPHLNVKSNERRMIRFIRQHWTPLNREYVRDGNFRAIVAFASRLPTERVRRKRQRRRHDPERYHRIRFGNATFQFVYRMLGISENWLYETAAANLIAHSRYRRSRWMNAESIGEMLQGIHAGTLPFPADAVRPPLMTEHQIRVRLSTPA